MARKNFLLTGRNLEQTPALGGRPSALTGWVWGEKETNKQIDPARRTETTIHRNLRDHDPQDLRDQDPQEPARRGAPGLQKR